MSINPGTTNKSFASIVIFAFSSILPIFTILSPLIPIPDLNLGLPDPSIIIPLIIAISRISTHLLLSRSRVYPSLLELNPLKRYSSL
jgi:hypothetical protein